MTYKEAEIAAYKKERAIKVAQVAGAVTVTAAIAYVGYHRYDQTVDRILKSGVELKRVSNSGDLAVHDGFYAVLGKNKLDVKKYAGMYANELGGLNGSDVYQKTISIGASGLKIASEKSGVAALRQIANGNTDEIRKALVNSKFAFAQLGRAGNVKACEKAIKSLDAGKIDRNVYNGLISAMGPLGKSEPKLSNIRDKLFKQLQANGYGGIQDINDKYFSGYRAKMPVIVFKANNVSVKAAKELEVDEIVKNLYTSSASIMLANAAPKVIARGAAAAGGYTVGKVVSGKQHDRIVAEYRNEHPNTTLSYNEIVRNYYRSLSA